MTLNDIIESVSKDYGITKTKLRGSIVKKEINEARKVIVKTSHKFGYTLEEIGMTLGGRGKSWASKALNAPYKMDLHDPKILLKYNEL